MDKIMRSVWAEVDLDKLAYNMKNIKKKISEKEVIAVVKADGYGHGAIDLVDTLIQNGADKLAVAVLTEGIELRRNNIEAPIIILGFTPLEFAKDLYKYNIEQTVYDLEYTKELSTIAKKNNTRIKVHIALDTGMGRIGFMPNKDSINSIKEISKLEGIEIVGLFTHFSTADESDKTYTINQFKKFCDFNEMLEEENINIQLKHVANSGAIIDIKETTLDAVRAGIILYGYYPSDEVNKDNLHLKPVLTLKAKVSHVKEMEKDMYISYGRTFKTKRKSIIATLPIGYADGYSRCLDGKGKVIINGKLSSIVGRICMDQCMIDVTDIGEVKVGDEVILLGSNGNIKYDADDIADVIGTINYEVLCMIKQRVPRVYKKNNKIINVRNYI